jgi:uncharacterized protein (DUF58 family)
MNYATQMKTSVLNFNARMTYRGKGMVVLLAVVLIFAMVIGEGVLYHVTYFLALVIAGSYVYVRLRLRGLDMQMENKSYVGQVGSILKGYVHLHNRSRLDTGWVEIVRMSDMPDGLLGTATAVSAGGQERLETHTPCYARGVYTVGPLLAHSSDPLGLFRAEVRQGKPMKAVIQPPIVPLPNFHLPVAELSGEEGARGRSQARTPHVATVREYIYGDSVNQIHWLSSAKKGQLMSKEFDCGWGGDIWIVLDLEWKIHYSQGMERSDEYAVAVTASLANVALREEHSVGLIAHGDREYRLPLGSGTKQMSSILETLTLSKTQGDSSLASVLLRNRHQFDSAASLIVVTSSTSTEWISIVRQLRYSDLNVAVVLVDATSFGGDQSPDKVVAELVGVGIPVYVVRRGDTLPYALSQPIISPEVLMFAHRDRSERIRSSAITG